MIVDETRSRRQEEIVLKWENNNKIGTVIAATGFGKTQTAILAGQKGLATDPNFTMLVIVPTLILQKQWISRLKDAGLGDCSEVVVINTACRNSYNVTMVVFDECHTVPAPEFSKSLDTIQYKYIMCLTATIERTDGKEKMILDVAPIIDEVTIEECEANDWVSTSITYNLAVQFTPEEAAAYKKANNTFKYAAAQGLHGVSHATEWANSGDKAKARMAGMYFNAMRKRREICINASNKVGIVKEIIERYSDRNVIVFSESADFANTLQSKIDSIAVTFHSKMKKKEQVEALKQFNDGRTKKRVICSVRALNAGLDLPELSLGIVAAGNSRKLDNIQRTGRIIRYIEGKKAVIVNLYVPDTQEVKWLEKRTEGRKVTWINNVNELEI